MTEFYDAETGEPKYTPILLAPKVLEILQLKPAFDTNVEIIPLPESDD
jgi:hypothetical protein